MPLRWGSRAGRAAVPTCSLLNGISTPFIGVVRSVKDRLMPIKSLDGEGPENAAVRKEAKSCYREASPSPCARTDNRARPSSIWPIHTKWEDCAWSSPAENEMSTLLSQWSATACSSSGNISFGCSRQGPLPRFAICRLCGLRSSIQTPARESVRTPDSVVRTTADPCGTAHLRLRCRRHAPGAIPAIALKTRVK